MIRINLVPVEDLDNKLWWVGDSIIAIVMLAISFVGVQYYINTVRASIEVVKTETTQVNSEVEQYTDNIKKYDDIEKKMREIQSKIDSLQTITKSKLAKYRPLILLELLQGLKPDGMWFDSIALDKGGGVDGIDAMNAVDTSSDGGSLKGKGITVSGRALENVMVAEFMSELQASSKNQVDPSDLRTQVYFTDVDLQDIKLESMGGLKKDAKGGSESLKVTSFKLKLNYVEREYKREDHAMN